MAAKRRLNRKGFLGILAAAGLGTTGALVLLSKEDEEPREAVSLAIFSTLADMRENCRESERLAFVADHTRSGDFGGGFFVRSEGEEDDDGGVHVRLDGSGALFKRVWDGDYVNPAWWGVSNDLSDDATPEIMKALDFAYPGTVRVGKGHYLVGSPIGIRGGNILVGPTARGDTQHHGPGCKFVLADGAGGNLIQSESSPDNRLSWHWGGLQHFAVDGNRANNPEGGHGIYIYRMAETAFIREVFIQDCKGSGVFLEDTGVPAQLFNLRSGFNDRYGFEFHRMHRVLELNGPSGDNNRLGFIRVNAANSGFSVSISNLKAERRTSEGAGTHDPLILLDDLQGAVVLITGGTAAAEPSAGDPADAVVKITGSPAKVVVQGFTALRYTNLIRDEVTGGVVSMSELDDSTSDWKHVKHYVYG